MTSLQHNKQHGQTLNVLSAFAQFEHEAIGERVRDKIAASKRKGFRVGGRVPLGYQNLRRLLKCQFRFQGENGLRTWRG